VVDEDGAASVLPLGSHLVAQDGPRLGAADLLDVRAAEPACADADELSVTVGLRDLRDRGRPGGVENNGTHEPYRREPRLP
jgi:hypothetical protein